MRGNEKLTQDVRSWFSGRIPDAWFIGPAEVSLDDEEILVVGPLPIPQPTPENAAVAEASRIDRFREETREARMRIAGEAQQRFRRRVSWGATCGSTRRLFTTLAMPVMTRLRMPERDVLDTLVDAGVARSRSEALAWCVRLVGKNQAPWIQELRTAMGSVAKVRSEGPVDF